LLFGFLWLGLFLDGVGCDFDFGDGFCWTEQSGEPTPDSGDFVVDGFGVGDSTFNVFLNLPISALPSRSIWQPALIALTALWAMRRRLMGSTSLVLLAV
jgi:hypothetical protein